MFFGGISLAIEGQTAGTQNTTSTVLSKKNPVYVLQLPSNPTTGYSWFLLSYDHNLLTLNSHRFVPPAKQIPGAGGHEEWTFVITHAALSGSYVTHIRLIYARPWEIQKGIQTKDSNIKDIPIVISDR